MKRARLWFQAARPFSLTVSIMPPIIGGLIAAVENPDLRLHFPHFVLALLGCVLAHAGSNMLSDTMDFRARVDRRGTYGSSGLLTTNLMQPAQLLRGAVICYGIALAIAIYFILVSPNGLALLWLILLGAVLGIFYTFGPFAWKYHALGDIAVFISFGPAMSLGAYLVQTGRFAWPPVLYILPLALLVDAILHSNNLRDIDNDKVAGIRTLPIVVGAKQGRSFYALLVYGSYLLILVLIIFSGLTWLAALTFISLPLALRLGKKVKNQADLPKPEFSRIDAETAQLHSVFGLLFIAALLLDLWVG
ncbi:MAG TPA: 1,4-dihydroxy-2-naphthoate octaprenyltransferase [bacterium]|jgi:1,4-dihydroxy-2-naphthoate octaprenyltransferase|nr:1,4-dihydroxy-2-naphthoate octaprenyltransferase [bacterium]HNT66443.1 1,4-dihydroxy-2-naphthoate octaprenyltransferase [bacterium]